MKPLRPAPNPQENHAESPDLQFLNIDQNAGWKITRNFEESAAQAQEDAEDIEMSLKMLAESGGVSLDDFRKELGVAFYIKDFANEKRLKMA